MRVRADTVERHDFPVRRHGYDPAEVDGAMGRIATSLHSYEEDIERLESDLSRARRAGEVFEESIAVIQETRERLLQEANEESHRMKSEAEEALSEARTEADELLGNARGRVDKLLSELKIDAEAAIAEAATEAEKRIANAETEAQRMLDAAHAESDRLIGEARKEAAARRSEAEEEARTLVAESRAEYDRLAVRVPQLRMAVSDIENRIKAFSSAAAEDLEVVDAMIEIADAESGGGVVSLVGDEPRDEDDAEGPTNEHPAELKAVPAHNGRSAAAQQVDEPAAVQQVDEPAAVQQVDEPAAVQRAEAPRVEEPLLAAVSAPDGSGTLPAARPVLDEGESPRENGFETGEQEVPSLDPVDEVAVAAEPDQGGPSPLARLRDAHHVASRQPDQHVETIYQRRGGGLRRRLDAGQRKSEE